MANLNLKAATLAATALLAGQLACLQAQNSPVGSWDFVLSGGQRGLMQVTFVNDFTLFGREIITLPPSVTHTTTDEEEVRTPGGTHREFDSGGNPVSTNIFGSATVGGFWTYDSRGRVLGIMSEVSTNSTNGISFSGTVRPGVRVTLTGYRNGRRIVYRGVPLTALADFSGNYYATGTRGGQPFNELFTFTPSGDPNRYTVAGGGPAYFFVGSAMVSAQRQAAFYTLSNESTNGTVRSVSGAFNLNIGAGTLLGISDPPGDAESAKKQNVRVRITKQ